MNDYYKACAFPKPQDKKKRKKMKKYKIREGSLLWALKNFWFVFIGAAILVWLAFPKPQEAQAESAPVQTVQPASATEQVPLYDVPLSADLQKHIKGLCDDYGVDMPLVLAIIGQESNYNADVVGDNGNSIGLMQIQPQHHQQRMDKLGVVDLTDPYQNVTVGIDLLAELMSENKGTEWAVTAYNAGASTADYNNAIGTRTEYAESVLILREMIENEKRVESIKQ